MRSAIRKATVLVAAMVQPFVARGTAGVTRTAHSDHAPGVEDGQTFLTGRVASLLRARRRASGSGKVLQARSPVRSTVALALVLAGGGQPLGLDPGSTPPGTPPVPGGAFIAYVKDSDVWVVRADGSHPQQVTRDGAAGAYRDPAVGPDGTIYALRDEAQLYHFDLTGRLIGSPAQLATLENGAAGLAVAPDGGHLAYVTTGWGTYVDPRFGTPTGTYIYGGTDVITPDGTSVPGSAMGSMLYPSWSGASTLVLSDGTAVYVDSLTSQPATWLAVDVTEGCLFPSDCPSGQEPVANFTRAVADRAGTMLAYQYQPFFGTAGRRFATIDAPPPAVPTVRCTIEGQEDYSDPGSFSADGRAFAFDDTVFDPDTFETRFGQGIWAMTIDLDATDCGLSTARLVAPGGVQPDWGPAGP